MILKVISNGNPSAFWDKHCPTQDEINELVQSGADYEDAADTKFIPCEPTVYYGDTDAILMDVRSGKTIRYDFQDGRCYSQNGDELSDDYTDATTDDNLKLLISQVEPLIGSPDNVTLVTQEDGEDEF